MIKLTHGVFGSVILLGGTILAGCGTSEHPVATGHHSQVVSQSTPASPLPSSTTSPSGHVSSSTPLPSAHPLDSLTLDSHDAIAPYQAILLPKMAKLTHMPVVIPTFNPSARQSYSYSYAVEQKNVYSTSSVGPITTYEHHQVYQVNGIGPISAYSVSVYLKGGGSPEFSFGEQEYPRNAVPVPLPPAYGLSGCQPLSYRPLHSIAYAGHFFAERPDALITWNDGGRWAMRIYGGNHTTANLKMAETVARALQQHRVTLPGIQEPGSSGFGILVMQNLGGGNFRTSIYWDHQGRWVWWVTGEAITPLNTLTLAQSMKLVRTH